MLVDVGEKHARSVRRSVGMVFQQFNLFPHFTALQNVAEPMIQVLRVMRHLAEHHEISMLLVTHEMSFAEDFANRVLMFDAGRIVEQGPPHEVLKAPAHPRTQQFLRTVIER